MTGAEVPDVYEAIRLLAGVDPSTWTGTLHLHLGGKTGETLYACGCIPALRETLPRARLALYLHPHYLGVVPGIAPQAQPDEVWGYPGPWGPGTVAEQVLLCLRRVMTQQGRKFWGGPEGVHVCLYAGHGRYLAPFYLQFARSALGLPRGAWQRPTWQPTRRLTALDDLALVFPTANEHSGTTRGLPVTPPQWGVLAAELRKRGLHPVATGNPDDGRPEMPGWSWLETGDVTRVLELLTRARVVVGPNSGITWASLLIAPGAVTMFDWQRTHERLYEFPMCIEDGVVDPARHFQIPGAEFSIEKLRAALSR